MASDLASRLYQARKESLDVAREVVGDGDYISGRYTKSAQKLENLIQEAERAGWSAKEIEQAQRGQS